MRWCWAQVGVSESIIMGIPMPTGTGLFKLRHHVGSDRAAEAQGVADLPQREAPLLLCTT